MRLVGIVRDRLQQLKVRWTLLLLVTRARLTHSTLDLEIGPGLVLGRRVKFRLQSGTHNRIRMGAGCSIGDDVVVLLKGATIDWGDRVEVRRGTVLNLSGTLRFAGRNIISYSNVIHCASSISLDEYASTNEFVSIIDSTHHHDGESEFFYENTSAAPITIGANAWICNKASVLMGTTIGANAVVASHSVVNHDVPEATVVGGLPAKVLGPRAVGGGALRFATERHAAVVGSNEG
jgi:acetyltransferase-like isoleucine patch superfamily enzyme